ncbi:Protein MSS2 mitochondrial [Spathaspora sp. JA1]|nr:Protein MSS2 mitochondrial [Spathaspora sp. JA1]
MLRIIPTLRTYSTTTTTAPPLLSILPSKRTLNKLLFDNDSRLSYKKMIPVLTSIYDNLDTPTSILLPSYVKSFDLMTFKNVLTTIRSTTGTIHPRLIMLEAELVEQAGELGDNDAITILAFETIEKKLNGGDVSKEDFTSANSLVKQLTDLNHPLVFKMGGDLAFKQNIPDKACEYWLRFIELESDTIMASHVYCNLGLYYFNKPDLTQAKYYFEKSVKFGDVDNFTIKAHYYLGQLYVDIDPRVSKYHWEIAASRGLKDAFQSLGFLELNMFENYDKSLEWFRLGVEVANDVACLIGQFDCYWKLDNRVKAFDILTKLGELQKKIKSMKNVPEELKSSMLMNQSLLATFFNTRSKEIGELNKGNII